MPRKGIGQLHTGRIRSYRSYKYIPLTQYQSLMFLVILISILQKTFPRVEFLDNGFRLLRRLQVLDFLNNDLQVLEFFNNGWFPSFRTSPTFRILE